MTAHDRCFMSLQIAALQAQSLGDRCSAKLCKWVPCFAFEHLNRSGASLSLSENRTHARWMSRCVGHLPPLPRLPLISQQQPQQPAKQSVAHAVEPILRSKNSPLLQGQLEQYTDILLYGSKHGEVRGPQGHATTTMSNYNLRVWPV